MHYIYLIQNTLNNKIYIGQTVNAKKRWRDHLSYSKKPRFHLHRAMAKDGIEHFTFMTIEEHETQDAANEAEEFWIGYFQTLNHEFGYNIKRGGKAGPHTDETKAKISKASIDLWQRDYDRMKEATLSGGAQFETGHEVKEEWKPAIIAANTGKKQSEETKAKRSASLKARYALQGSKVTGRKQSQEEKDKRAASNRGKKRSEETKEKMRKANNPGQFTKKAS